MSAIKARRAQGIVDDIVVKRALSVIDLPPVGVQTVQETIAVTRSALKKARKDKRALEFDKYISDLKAQMEKWIDRGFDKLIQQKVLS